MEEKRNSFDEIIFDALSSLGSLMACNEVCRDQRAVMKINRFRAWLMDLKPQDNTEPISGVAYGLEASRQPEPNMQFDGRQLFE